ncbi:unnamed protein product [Staurois parvus]|uniref:Uncharacterized protein n=1 Tax=Staurois parvus TaxID=386267 RepID=A0ABN9DU30_9NEOB|nr:unnamed protein product [Staurois parvus]
MYSSQSASLHSKYPFPSYFPIRVPPFHRMCKSECPFPSHVLIRVPLSTVCAHLCSLT